MRYAARGFSLVELMISMLLGLVIIGAATGVILANRQSYRTNEGLSQIQESARNLGSACAVSTVTSPMVRSDSARRFPIIVSRAPIRYTCRASTGLACPSSTTIRARHR